jgi:hypothetical protein
MKRALLLPLLAPALLAAGEPPVVLRYQFQAGQALRYRTELTQRLRLQNPKGQLGNLDVTSGYVIEMAQKVTAVGPGPEFEIAASPQKVEVKLDGPMAKSAPQIAEMLRKVGFTLKLDSRGQVKNLSESAETPEQLKKLVATLKGALGQLMPMLPEEPQAPGGRWRQQLKVPVELPSGDKIDALLTVDYLLRGYAQVRGHSCADVGMRLHIGIAGALGQSATRVEVTGVGTGQGFAFFDLERGLLVETGVALATESRFKSDAVQLSQASDTQMRMILEESGAPEPRP